MLNLSKEQLTKLVLHTAAVNSILTEALLGASEPEPAPVGTEVEIDVFVIDPGRAGRESEQIPAQAVNLDALCGDWKCRRQPDLSIFKAAPGYLIALGKKPKKGETGDCYLLHEADGKICFNAGFGTTYLSYDEQADTITLYPGGEYHRTGTDKN